MDDLYRSPLLAWLSPKGPEGDVVISSRVRLARNFDRMPFPDRADASQLAAVKKTASALLPAIWWIWTASIRWNGKSFVSSISSVRI